MENKIKMSKYVAKYRASHREQILERQRLKRKNFPLKRMIWNAKRRAKEKGLAFDLQESDLIQVTYCPYLNIPLHYEGGKPREDCTASLDKIDPSQGYIKGNVEIISDLANRMKNNASIEMLLLFAQSILKRFDNGSSN
jgi:hypothetical protein